MLTPDKGHPFVLGEQWVVIRMGKICWVDRYKIIVAAIFGISVPVLRHKFGAMETLIQENDDGR